MGEPTRNILQKLEDDPPIFGCELLVSGWVYKRTLDYIFVLINFKEIVLDGCASGASKLQRCSFVWLGICFFWDEGQMPAVFLTRSELGVPIP